MYQDFSSMPPEQEREFIVFEQRTRESAKSASTIGIVSAAIFGLLTIIVVMSHDAPPPLIGEEDIAGSSIMDEDTAPARTAPAPEPEPEPAAVEAEPEAAEGEAAEAPPPPPGATKAPPTALTGDN